MNEDKVASREYMVMNPLVEEGMEPDYVWTLMRDMVLTFPNFEEFEDGARVIVLEFLKNEEVSSITFRNERMECWIRFYN